ncbi:uncharacterized protein BP01DRAFT_9941 [Aspergillus saccharolyticus JOP 1030-1]|uniref:Uncharacterized protein n=1 Tax=Aspergillus saccharolyticus JOP 1030-1 TaxID=1450539 RepID=A0A318ZTB5_9EURO|nr:hypothetical protein BP01DRAFT_9941 [Aspergillus saccharolyticus JOP 1030-1]PYH49945.1 hypothetical protein BP01DRAFT_9941 [Aspergillus saccharolyticus JOP 1030-1]
MRWTPEADQLLLLKILETHNLSVNSKKVAEAWPVSANQQGPTPRAISERLVKIRNMAGTSFSISKGSDSNTTPTATPRKSRKSAPSTPSSAKRKHDAVKAESIPPESVTKSEIDGPVKMEVETTPFGIDNTLDSTPTRKTPLAVGAANQLYAGHPLYVVNGPAAPVPVDQNSPSKRVRKQTSAAPGMIDWTGYDGDEKEVETESSASEYCPDPEMVVATPRRMMMNYI